MRRMREVSIAESFKHTCVCGTVQSTPVCAPPPDAPMGTGEFIHSVFLREIGDLGRRNASLPPRGKAHRILSEVY